MKKSWINALILVLVSWYIYEECQADLVLPFLCLSIITVLIVPKRRAFPENLSAVDRMPYAVICVLSILGGLIWRRFIPIPEHANAPFIEFISSLQSGSIMAATVIALRQPSTTNCRALNCCAWATVALSMDVPLNQSLLVAFPTFAFIAISLIIIETMRRPSNHASLTKYARDYLIFSVVLIASTSVMFFILVWSILVREDAFFNMVNHYMLNRNYSNFLNVSQILSLSTPGTSAFDRRPVMEIRLPNSVPPYLKMQVFDDYFNGSWGEPVKVPKTLLPSLLNGNQAQGEILMFSPLKRIIPSPEGITAIHAEGRFFRNDNGLILADTDQNTRFFKFSWLPPADHINLTDEQLRLYTKLPRTIAGDLKEIAQSIVGTENDPISKANKITAYLRDGFSYSLTVDFKANNEGLLRMLREKRPAYCTYFASALTLLLRAEGIPARVATGFLVTEQTDARTNTYLARVRDAHAWCEALLPVTDNKSGQTIFQWQTLDATPADFKKIAPPSLNNYFLASLERMWLSTLRLIVILQHMDKDLLQLYTVFLLCGILMLMNRQKIINALFKKRSPLQKHALKSPNQAKLQELYRQYERYLKEEFGVIQHASETDGETIARLKEKPDSITAIGPLETFISAFHAARFGKTTLDLATLQALFATLPRTRQRPNQFLLR